MTMVFMKMPEGAAYQPIIALAKFHLRLDLD